MTPETQFRIRRILSRVRADVDQTLLLHAPAPWPTEKLDAIEARVMTDAKNSLQNLNREELFEEETFWRQVSISCSAAKERCDPDFGHRVFRDLQELRNQRALERRSVAEPMNADSGVKDEVD